MCLFPTASSKLSVDKNVLSCKMNESLGKLHNIPWPAFLLF